MSSALSRSSGIGIATSTAVSVGDEVQAHGAMSTSSGERILSATNVTRIVFTGRQARRTTCPCVSPPERLRAKENGRELPRPSVGRSRRFRLLDDDLDAAILLTTFFRRVVGNRVGLSATLRVNPGSVDLMLLHEVFLDAFGKEAPTTTVVERREGETHLRVVSGNELSYWLQQYTLGELFRSKELEAMK